MSTVFISDMPPDKQSISFQNSSQLRQKAIEEEYRKTNLPKGFYIKDEGLWYAPEALSENPSDASIYVSSVLYVIAIVRDHQNERHARLLEFYDADGHKHTWVMSMELLAGDGVEYRRELLDKGLSIGLSTKAKRLLAEYIQLCQPTARVRCVSQTGWCQNCFIFPLESIGEPVDDKILYLSTSYNQFGYGARGILEKWQQISLLCKGNSRLIFALSAAFAAPFLTVLGEEGGGFHFRGQSSTGKTTVVKVACSVWGGTDYMKSWRATANGLEGIAAGHNDTLLCLDEIEEIAPTEIGSTAYMLANGTGKTRSNQYGIARKRASWKLLLLSTGEISLSDHSKQAGKKVRAGHEVRILDIPADTGKYGIFEDLHGYVSGDEFAKALCSMCREHYGLASREFLKRLIPHSDGELKNAKDIMRALMERHLPKNACSQVARAFHRFAIVAAAGEIATSLGITGWESGEAANAAMKCFSDWLRSRGGIGMQEEAVIIAQVKKFLELHGSSRFCSCDAATTEAKTHHRAGFIRPSEEGIEYLILGEVFRSEICEGFDHRLVSKICIRRGYLLPDSENKATRPERIPALGRGTTRVYKFNSKILTDDIGETGETICS